MRLGLILCLTLLVPSLAQAGGSKADYQRAKALRKAARAVKLDGWVGEIVWGPAGAVIARVQTATGDRFVHVDSDSGEKQDAFDRAAVSAKIKAWDSDKTQGDFRVLSFTADHVVALAGSVGVSIDRESGAAKMIPLASIEALRLKPARARNSRDGGSPTQIIFVNATKAPIRLVWLNRKGKASSYGSVKPGETHRQHTYVGHLWRVTDDKDQRITEYFAESAALVAHVDGSDAPRVKRQFLVRSPDKRLRIMAHGPGVAFLEDGKETVAVVGSTKTDRYTRSRLAWSPRFALRDGRVRRRDTTGSQAHLGEQCSQEGISSGGQDLQVSETW